MARKVNNTTVDQVDKLIRAVENHREQLVRQLFPDASKDYLAEWCDRSAFRFWCHLDAENRKRAIEIATEIYS